MEGEIITIETAQKLAEYDKLKKQYEKVLNDYCRLDAYNKTQQKEFVKYLEEKEKQFDIVGDPIKSGACCGILNKYKEIIGGK